MSGPHETAAARRTPAAHWILRQIRALGPMTVGDYMAACLTHPEFGYYAVRTPLGREGDFITAPEISQMFGELLGLSLAQAWLDQGAPAPFCLAELGPGRGTLMADLLRATRQVPGFHDAMRLTLMDSSGPLRADQARALAPHAPAWIDGLSELPEMPLFLVANEFFDCLPVRQFLRAGDGWRERMVTAQGDAGSSALAFALSPEDRFAALEPLRAVTPEGEMVEYSAPSEATAATLGAHVARYGGAALIVDYGAAQSRGDTLQAVSGHRRAGPLDAPGETDLTAHVAFGPLAAAAHPAGATGPVPQGVFLERLGITARAQALAQGMTGAAFDTHVAAHRRLTHPEEMGNLFQVMAIHPKDAPPPPGLAE
ncbi:class I SAM-dependent methyltransferase [Mesobaculum littorinae]|uniref:Class I SAM-dependent methyltransferase n=1 Tax=Mesobaculum littorinae TaxID=2486419 RepID=A0A438AKL9_9RHOB|nr:SAM-dependent methyltransferase [Mesobaculum littorinae]RVV99146.1 class I SAM-dependent methyltransferase [Mesobaculum littorinae]